MRYRLRTLLILLAVGPIAIWAAWSFWPRPGPAELPPPFSGDDIQYFVPGPDFKLSREAAAQKAYKADLEAAAAKAVESAPAPSTTIEP
jgi:hypothetical protein